MLRITIALSIYSFAASLVGVFVPLVILKSGGQLWEIPAFYLIYAAFKLLINYPVVLFIQKKGAHTGVGVAFVAGALQMISILGFATTHEWMLLVAGAISLAFTNAFLWNSQHFFISKAMQDDSKSSSMATIAIINQLSGVVAPLLGGFIGTYLGFGFLLSLDTLNAGAVTIFTPELTDLSNQMAQGQSLSRQSDSCVIGGAFNNWSQSEQHDQNVKNNENVTDAFNKADNAYFNAHQKAPSVLDDWNTDAGSVVTDITKWADAQQTVCADQVGGDPALSTTHFKTSPPVLNWRHETKDQNTQTTNRRAVGGACTAPASSGQKQR